MLRASSPCAGLSSAYEETNPHNPTIIATVNGFVHLGRLVKKKPGYPGTIDRRPIFID
jgi:hypothetical protein